MTRERVEVLAPPTAEMTRWTERLDRTLFRPEHELTSRLLRTAMVTPLAHVASLSFEFQAYLYAVFHRTRLARVVHIVCMPLIVLSTVATISQIAPAFGWGAAGVLALFYAVLSVRNRMWLLGAVMLPVTAALAWAATMWAAAGVGIPALWMVGLSLIQTLSHSLEHVPPRVSGGPDWISVREFFLGTSRVPHGFLQFARRLVRAAAMAVAGTLNELTGSWRLLPTVVVRGMWKLGYQRARHARLRALVDAATRHDNPAVDFIGTGGARDRVRPGRDA